MTNFEYIKSMSIDELAVWLDKLESWENAPWAIWWNSKYCNNCESVKGTFVDSGRECDFSWCEMYGKCKFFQELENVPNTEDVLKMWLENDVEVNK